MPIQTLPVRSARIALFLAVTLAPLALGCQTDSMDEMPVDAPSVRAATDIEAGRYLVTIGGCNDCHTNGYMQTEGAVPEGDWLLGSPVGWRGPWGTPYAPNLRLTAQSMTEAEWVTMLKTRNALPPMPWMNVNKFHERDARAIYRYISSLEPSGEMMPAALPPGQEPTTPFLLMEPQNLPTADNR